MTKIKTKFWLLLERKKYYLGLIGLASIFLVSFLFFKNTVTVDNRLAVNQSMVVMKEKTVARQLDGWPVEAGQENLLPISVMIDNHFDAWPLAGVAGAQLVYEAPVEGVFSRLLVVYAGNDLPAKIGPVRSARPYFVEWAEELGGWYLHSGGSEAALKKLQVAERVTDVNEFYRGKYFWRDNNRAAPHNLFTSAELLLKYQENYPIISAPQYDSWLYAVAEAGQDHEQKVSFNYSHDDDLAITWQYRSAYNDYQRYVGGAAVLAGTAPVTAKNIIFQFMPVKVIDDVGRKQIKTVGAGEIILLQNGAKISGQWQKDSLLSRTKFYLTTGEEIKLIPGVTWIEVLPIDWPINFS